MKRRRSTAGAGVKRVAAHPAKRKLAATEQYRAITDILRVITSSPGDAQPVFDAIVRRALRLVGGYSALVLRLSDGMLHLVAHSSTSRSGDEALKRFYPQPAEGVFLHGRAIHSRRPFWVADTEKVPASMADVRSMARKRGYRSLLVVPMLRDDVPIGSIGVSRRQAGEFSEQQIRTLEGFADQAVIAIENVRLFNETKEGLERQTATAEILRVIASSPSSTQPVFDAIAQSAQRLIGAHYANVTRLVGDELHLAAHTGSGAAADESLRRLFPAKLTGQGALGRAVLSREPACITDVETDPAYSASFREGARERGYRSLLAVPMLRDGASIGAIAVTRRDPGPFTDHQINLLKTFADQAVIAIENVRLFNETKEALERQTATGEILSSISSSMDSAQPVFDTIVRNLRRLFGTAFAAVFLARDDKVDVAAADGEERFVTGARAAYPLSLDDEEMLAVRAIRRGQVLRVCPIVGNPQAPPKTERLARASGYDSIIVAPMMREGVAIGAIATARTAAVPFDDRQVSLMRSFADQAVIAIENARLFNETKEALEQQTATAEILKVISASPTATQPVFESIVNKCHALFQDSRVALWLIGDEQLLPQASTGYLPEPMPLDRESGIGACVLQARTIHLPDLKAGAEEYPRVKQLGLKHGYLSGMYAPLLREGRGIGGISVLRRQAGAFSDKEVALLSTFADQAVIAIENARLFTETKEALEQQTAISEVLRVISSSPADVQPVLQAVAERAARICDASDARIMLVDGAQLRNTAGFGDVPIPTGPGEGFPLDRTSVAGRAVLDRAVVHIEDILAQPASEFGRAHDFAQRTGARTVLAMPLMREDRALGGIVLPRVEVRPFNDKQIQLLRTFADQAAIAIENVRLFNETKEALERQTATADILKVISRFDTDVQPVFDAIAANALGLCRATTGWVYRFDGDLIHIASAHGLRPDAVEVLRQDYPMRPGRGAATARAILTCSVVHIPNIRDDDEYTLRDLAGAAAYLSVLSVPMLLEGKPIGAITVTGAEAGAFTPRQIELLQTFAEQAVIAIQNAHLFREIREKSAQLEVANRHKSEFLANMSHELRTPLNAIIGFSEALSDQMFGEVNEKQLEYLKDIHESGRHLLSLINDILDLSKIEAGRMELEVSTFHLPSALTNAMTLIRERAQRHGIRLGLEVDEQLAEFSGDERKFKQIMLNLLSNAVKFTPDGGQVDVSAKRLNGQLEVAVRDTGIGIAPEDQTAVFEEFKQVGRDRLKKAEGTGLGLALTKRFVELHGGAIRLDSAPGKGSTFTVSLPLR